jgi:hypothetical protein
MLDTPSYLSNNKFYNKIKTQLYILQCCGTGAGSRGAEIKYSPRAAAEITHCGSGSFQLTTDLTKCYGKYRVAAEIFVNCYNFNPIIKVKKDNFQGTSIL